MTKIKKDVVVEAPVDVVYAAWRNFENFPSFMQNIEDVRVSSDSSSHWKAAHGALGISAEWDAEITLDEPGRSLGWRSLESNSTVIVSGRVNFEDLGGRSRVEVTIEYAPPGGPVGGLVAAIVSHPGHQVEEDLQRFKEIIESSFEFSGPRIVQGPAGKGVSVDGGSARDLDGREGGRRGKVPPAA